MEIRSAKSTTYFVKRVHNTLYIEMLYWDETERVPTKRHKSKKLVLGKIGEPFFEPVDWLKKLMK